MSNNSFTIPKVLEKVHAMNDVMKKTIQKGDNLAYSIMALEENPNTATYFDDLEKLENELQLMNTNLNKINELRGILNQGLTILVDREMNKHRTDNLSRPRSTRRRSSRKKTSTRRKTI
jgi:hypothetical protein